MGDVLMATPAMAALRRALPDAHIAMAVGGWSKQAVANNPRLNGIIDAPVGSEAAHGPHYMRWPGGYGEGNFGAALVLDRSPLLNMVPYLAHVPVRAGLDSENAGPGAHPPCAVPARQGAPRSRVVPRRGARPRAARSTRGIRTWSSIPTEEEKAQAERALAEAGAARKPTTAMWLCTWEAARTPA